MLTEEKCNILLIEDEAGVIATVTDRLEGEGYIVHSVQNGDEGLRRALGSDIGLIILDLMLPGRGGFEVCSELRRRGVQTPILMLSARGELVDRVTGLKLGADDYLAKPFAMAELVARLEVLLRRAQPRMRPLQGFYGFGDVSVSFDQPAVMRAGQPIELTARELELLRYFIRNRGMVLSRFELLKEVWGYDRVPSTRTVDVHVLGLRQKLERDPAHPTLIVTISRQGYKFVG
jgi:two-component system alkaline phosphatase synthesis response regulator PhoP